MKKIKTKAINTLINSLTKDGQEYVLKNGKIVRVKPSMKLAKEMIDAGIFNDWLQDEISYLNSINL